MNATLTRRVLIVLSVPLLVASSGAAQNALDRGQTNAPARPGRPADDRRVQPAQPGSGLGTGRALDASTRVGSGGQNDARRSFQQELAFRNAIVTGNVAGGKAFRADVGYAAADDFRGDTGSDDLFEFQRDSAYSGLATQNLRGLSALQFTFTESTGGQTQGILGDLIIRRESSTASSADVGVGTDSAATIDPYGNLKGSLRSTSDFVVRNARFPRILGSLSRERNSDQQFMTATALQGVRPLKISNPAFSQQERPDLLKLLGQSSAAEAETPAETPELSTPVGERIDPRTPFDRYREGLAQRANPRLSNKPGDPAPTTPGQTPADPAAQDGEPGAAPSSAAERLNEQLEQLRRSFNEKYFGEDAQKIEPPTRESRPGDTEDQSSPGDAESDIDAKTAQKPLTPAEIIEAARALRDEDGSAKITELLAGKDARDLYDWHLSQGQEMLRTQRWFDAEERFTAALRMKPGDALASAGRVNAQLGAGMFVSASLNMRNMFAAYPEMMPARYSDDLFIRAPRLDAVRTTLRERIKAETAFSSEAALLLAYVGYQTGNTADIAHAFDALDRQHMRDRSKPSALELAARAVWTSDALPVPVPAPAR